MLRPVLVLLLLAVPATAQTPAERASRALNREVATDRARDAAQDARETPRPEIPGVQQFEGERRTIRPDVGRPEESGSPTGDGMQRGSSSMGPNPQR